MLITWIVQSWDSSDHYRTPFQVTTQSLSSFTVNDEPQSPSLKEANYLQLAIHCKNVTPLLGIQGLNIFHYLFFYRGRWMRWVLFIGCCVPSHQCCHPSHVYCTALFTSPVERSEFLMIENIQFLTLCICIVSVCIHACMYVPETAMSDVYCFNYTFEKSCAGKYIFNLLGLLLRLVMRRAWND